MSSSDPGGGPPDWSTLKENFSQQQAQINALKELVRQSEAGKNTASAQEKAKNIAKRLTSLKMMSSRSRQGVKSISEVNDDVNTAACAEEQLSHSIVHDDILTPPVFVKARSETPGSEKIQLLRKQMEQNRLKMAEHEHRKLDVKEKITQLKVNLDSSQKNLEKSHLGRSIGDLSILSTVPCKDKYQSASDLTGYATIASLDKDRIRYLEKKVRELEIDIKNKENDFLHRDPESEHIKTIKNLENKILDYQENLKEKECVIEARTQAVSLLSENMSMKGKNTIDLLEDTKQEMFKMQQRFIEAEDNYKREIEVLNAELDNKNFKVSNLEEVNDILETTRYDLTIKNSALEGQANDAQEYTNKLNELNKLNQSLQHRITDLENKKPDDETTTIVDELTIKLDRLQVENDDLKKLLQVDEQPATDADLRDKIRSLEAKLQQQQEVIDAQILNTEALENKLHEKTIEYNVLNANFSVLQEKLKSSAPKSLFSMSTDEEAEAEITKLKAQLDDANKSMIKNKLKTKQLQKQVDSVKKMSDINNQVIALTEQNFQLQQRITELESNQKPFLTSSALGGNDTDLEQRLHVLETTCQNQISAIQLLEEQKIDITEDLHTTKHELTSLKDNIKVADDEDETARVQCQMDSIEQEEKLEDYIRSIASLREDIERLTDDNERLTNEKTVLNEKLDSFITENFELLDKLDKLSKGSGSSAESIEIVENLTHQEKLEMEEFQQSLLHKDEDSSDNNTMSKDLSESLIKLREESSELMHKIEMFTNERREVLDKMEVLTADNAKLVHDIQVLSESKEQLESSYNSMEVERNELKKSLKENQAERQDLLDNIRQLNANRTELKEEINNLIKLSASEADNHETIAVLPIAFAKESYVKCLKSLEVHIENYRKAKEKNVKNETAKKLAKEAKNTHDLLTTLLVDHEQCVEQFNNLRSDYEQKIQVKSSENVLNKSHYANLELKLNACKTELQKLESYAAERTQEIERLTAELEAQANVIQSNENQSDETAQTIETLQHDNERLKNEIERLESTVTVKNCEIESNVQELASLRQEFNTRIVTYEKEIDILKVLVAEQKAQLIDTITEYQNEIDEKTKLIEDLEQQVEISKSQSSASREQYVEELNDKMVSLKQLFDDNNDLLEQQADELKNKQETIDLLNAQIMDLYKNMESSSNQIIEKEDEINYMQEIIDTNRAEIQKLSEKCQLSEYSIQQLTLDVEEKVREVNAAQNTSSNGQEKKIASLTVIINELENKNKEQLEKLKKFAANLKKKNAQCMELETRCQQLSSRENTSEDINLLNQQLRELQHLLGQREEELNVIRHENSRITVTLQQSNSSAERDSTDNANAVLALEDEINHLSAQNADLQIQLNQLNEQLSDTKLQAEARRADFANRSAELENFNSRFNEKVQAMEKLNHELEQRNTEIVLLRSSCKELDTIKAQLLAANEDIHGKNLKLVKCKTIIKEKNKEIMRLQDEVTSATEKLKNLEETLAHTTSDSQRVDEHLSSELQTVRETLNVEIQRLQNELNEASLQYTELKSIHDHEHSAVVDLKEQLSSYDTNIAILQQQLVTLQSQFNDLAETSSVEIQNLQERLNENATSQSINVLELKLQENQHFIETIQQENSELKDKISKLEEGIGYIEERRSSLERQAILLGTQLHNKTEELEQSEHELQDRLNVLSSQDVIIEQKLKEAAAEKQELQENLKEINDAKSALTQRVAALENQLSEVQDNLHQFEEENASLNRQNQNLQFDLTRETAEFHRKIAESRAEVDVLESDLSAQLEKIENERRRLHEELEKSNDYNSELQCDIVRFKEIITSLEQSNSDLEREMSWIKLQNEGMAQDQVEVQELRMQIVHDQTEIENLKSQNQSVQQNHDVEVAALKQQLAELDSLRTQIGQNQTDDQMFIQNENERLQALLASREVEIQNYQRQNLQLQMSTGGGAAADPFAVLTGTGVNEAEKKISELEQQVQQNLHDISEIQAHHVESQNELQSKLQIIKELETTLQQLKSDVTELHLRCQEIQNEYLAKDAELAEVKSELSRRPPAEAPVEVIETPAVQNIQFAELSLPPPQVSTPSAAEQKCDELERNIHSLEQYISDIQIQLRISTNDCEQLSQTVQSLEEEIHTRSRAYEEQISSLQTNSTDVIDRNLPPMASSISIPEPEVVPSFNSSMFFDPNIRSPFDIAVQPVVSPPKPIRPSTPEPVVEEIIIPKTAYICGPAQALEKQHSEQYVNEILNQLRTTTNDCEQLSQTVQSLETEIQERCQSYEEQLRQLREELNLQVVPKVTETVPTPSIFFTTEAAPSPFDAVSAGQSVADHVVEPLEFAHDDGWGFGSDEAVLEEQHQQLSGPAVTLSSRPSELESRIRHYEDKIDELTLETDRLRNDNIALQVKSGKMLKKLKEYKNRNDELSTFKKSPSVESNELDLAIQEELNSQIKTLETRIKEMKADQDKDNIERQALLKRVDVLTSANDRLTEMKERQDSEMEVCKNRCRQLTQKLEQLEKWDDDNYTSKTSDIPAPGDDASAEYIANLKKQIAEQRLDNDDVQALLDEEKEHSSILESRIRKLQESLLAKSTLEEEHLQSVEKLKALIADNNTLKSDITRKTATILELEARVSLLKDQMNDSVATIDALSVESNNIKTYLDQLKADHASKIDENNNLSKELRLLSDKNIEMADEVNRLKSSEMFGDRNETAELETRLQDLTATIQYKDAQIMHLNQKVDDAIQEDQTPQLIQEILNKNQEINTLRTQVRSLENDKCELENNLSLQLTKEMTTVPSVEGNTDISHSKVIELEKELKELHSEKGHMEHELQVLNDQVLSTLDMEDKLNATLLDMDSKNIEISELKQSLSRVTEQQQAVGNSDIVEHLQKIQLLETQIQSLNTQWEQVLEQRCTELAESWRQHLAQREAEFESVQTQLHQELLAKTGETTAESSLQPIGADESYDASVVLKMQEALESQEMEIVTLKEQLAIRSAEYARIAAQVDPFGQMTTMSNMTSMDYKTKKSTESLESNAGKKSELDLALYMLHQRDMRCEEMTEELISLLEERDTLQLKLSNSIRQLEAFKGKSGDTEVTSDVESTDTSPEKLASMGSRVSTADHSPDTQHEFTKLNDKISQLQIVGHSRDKTLREERDHRRRQMAILQRDVATLPPEAVAELIGADYTMSRSTTAQSQPSQLLSWLWGKSTPKHAGEN